MFSTLQIISLASYLTSSACGVANYLLKLGMPPGPNRIYPYMNEPIIGVEAPCIECSRVDAVKLTCDGECLLMFYEMLRTT